MTVRVLQKKSFDRYGSSAFADGGALRWMCEREDGPILHRSYFDTKQEAEQAARAARELQRPQPGWELAMRSDWRL
jgi:hypothetical protein